MRIYKEWLIINIGTLFTIAVFLCGCGNNKNAKNLEESLTTGTIHVSADESFKPVIDSEVEVFEASHPKAKILAHPTGRLLNQRPGYEIDWDRLFSFAAENHKALEINSWPLRLDLPEPRCRDA